MTILANQNIFIILALAISLLIRQYPLWINYSDDNMHAYFLGVGQGDATLIKLPNRQLILVDGGPNEDVVYELASVLPFWVNKIDLVIVTHSHADHIAGLILVMEQYDINCVFYRIDDDSISDLEDKFRALLPLEASNVYLSSDIPDSCIKKSDRTLIKNFYLSGYQMEDEFGKSSNENYESIITLVKADDYEILLTGDSETPEQELLLDYINEYADDIEVIKVPHHGSKDSLYDKLIDDLKPDVAVIEVGANNRFGHPDTEVLDFYNSRNIEILRTDEVGTVHVVSN